MNHFFLIMMVVAMVAVVVSLVLGLAVMVKGGEIDRKYSNKLMQARVTLQGIAILFFILAMMVK